MPSGQDVGCDRSRVLTWFASRWRNHQPKRAEKPHSIIRGRKAPDGPATRPKTPLAVENGVGKPAAPPRRERLMSARERERGALPPPICPCPTERLGRDIFLRQPLLVSPARQMAANPAFPAALRPRSRPASRRLQHGTGSALGNPAPAGRELQRQQPSGALKQNRRRVRFQAGHAARGACS
jgi:hypothetical protein